LKLSQQKNFMEEKSKEQEKRKIFSENQMKKTLVIQKEIIENFKEDQTILPILKQKCKFYHNNRQELKGNIRVFCRVRPILDKEKEENIEGEYIRFDGKNTISLYSQPIKSIRYINNINNNNNMNSQFDFIQKDDFSFDRVFTPEDNQKVVFEEISEFVQSALYGCKVCIFAYGQTGSGKTFTMQGEGGEKKGVITRSIEKILECKKSYEQSWIFKIEVSVLEVYCEQVRDLLNNSNNNLIRDIKLESPIIKSVENQKDFDDIMKLANEKRVVAETNCNEMSSRSHCIFQIIIKSINQFDKNLNTTGALNLIDLAGSERINKSKVKDER